MNTTFDINRLGLLLKRFFTENKQRELTFWGITTVIFTFMHLAGSRENSTSVEIFLYISGFIFAARTFKIFNYAPSGMHYLLIPATHFEKVTTSILLSTFYYFAMFILTYTIGTVLGTSIGNFFFELNNPIQLSLFEQVPNFTINSNSIHSGYSSGGGILNTFIAFAGIQSVFLLGSIYFKGNAVGKTFLAIFGISIILVLVELFLLRVTFGTFHLNGQMLNLTISPDQNMFSGFEIAGNIFKYALIPFFWVVTYFRLTEKQV